jgi:hypothetical protein
VRYQLAKKKPKIHNDPSPVMAEVGIQGFDVGDGILDFVVPGLER